MRDSHDEASPTPAAVRALAGIIAGDADLESVLQRACVATKSVIPGADEVSVTILEADRPRTVASVGDLAMHVDLVQYEAEEGPCLDAARNGRPVHVSDLEADDRWAAYRMKAIDAGIRASLSVPLEMVGSVAGALNIYSRERASFDDEVIDVAFDLAHYTSIVATASDAQNRATVLAQQMREAMESRAVIEQAKGILMAQRRITADEAFEMLVRASQEGHRKLRDVAQALVAQTSEG
ncbi:MAG: GAF and ANTAR domain-containing protein [Frankiaceae bacterium]|nr:GAF and ANTAR domain-containing protein [Frankiaceae bacterium]MBV9872170.1 GAF and ANTAR domain-containing protein [Frankiaceae bacterium]